MLLSYPAARSARVKSDYYYCEGAMSACVPLGGQAEVPDDVAYAILERDGDIIKCIGPAPAKPAKPVKAAGKAPSASAAAGQGAGTPKEGDATGPAKTPAYAQADLTLEE